MSKKYVESDFPSPEYNLRFEAKTKQWQVTVQGKKVATRWGKIEKMNQSNLKEFDTHDEAVQHAAKVVQEKTTGADKYQLKDDVGSKKIGDLPEVKKAAKASSRKKKTTEEGGEEAEEETKKRGRPSKKGGEESEKKIEEVESEAKKAKHEAGEDAGTKAKASAGKEEEVKMDTSESEKKIASPSKATAAAV